MVVSKALHYAGQVVLGVLGTVQGGGVEYRAVAVPQRPLFKRSIQSGTSYRSLTILAAEFKDLKKTRLERGLQLRKKGLKGFNRNFGLN